MYSPVGQHGVLAGRQRVGNGVAAFLAVGGRAVNLYRIGIFFLIISLRQVHRYGHYAFVGVWRIVPVVLLARGEEKRHIDNTEYGGG